MTSPLARRDWFVEAQARRRQALGLAVPTEAIQRQAAEDLRLLDAARAAGHLRVKSDVGKKRRQELRESRKAGAQAAQIGGRMQVRSNLPAVDAPIGGKRYTGVDAERIYAMANRLRFISRRTGDRILRGADLESGFQYPALARAAAEAVMNHDARRGEYAGKSAEDRDRILIRQLEDVCDRSNAVLPAWWVK